MINNKASVKDNICIKLCKKGGQILKKGGQILINMPHSFNKMIWIEEKVPTEWKTNIRAPVYKNKGEKLQSKL
jgi:D-hexose-6-phosphate mutarotase